MRHSRPRVPIRLVPVIAAVLGCVAGYVFLSTGPNQDVATEQIDAGPPRKAGSEVVLVAPAGSMAQASAEPKEEVRHQAMLAAYASLEKERRELAERLGLLKAQLWQVKLQADPSKSLTRLMMQGHALLRNPPLLGAFADALDIEQERARLRAVQSGLDDLQPVIEAARASAGGAPGS
ncbi:MAG: hypothetical protein HYY48_00815 [Gammaproteobacteria bacterium]|nr:hypothetical protein [Gammaproteobacteria bacterium]